MTRGLRQVGEMVLNQAFVKAVALTALLILTLPVSSEVEQLIWDCHTRHLSNTILFKLLLDVSFVVVPTDEVCHEVIISGDPDHNRFKLKGGNMEEELSQTLLHLWVFWFLTVYSLDHCHIITVESNPLACPFVTPEPDRDNESNELFKVNPDIWRLHQKRKFP